MEQYSKKQLTDYAYCKSSKGSGSGMLFVGVSNLILDIGQLVTLLLADADNDLVAGTVGRVLLDTVVCYGGYKIATGVENRQTGKEESEKLIDTFTNLSH